MPLFSTGTPTTNDVILFQEYKNPEIKTFIERGKKFTITGTIEYVRDNHIKVIRDEEDKEHINEFFLLYFSQNKRPRVQPNMTVKVNCQENEQKYKGRDSLWVAIYADILAIYCPHATIDVEQPFTNKWRSSINFTHVITSKKYPKEIHSSWIPIINYNRVRITNGQIKLRKYKKGSKEWRKFAHKELYRFGEKKIRRTERTFT